MAAQRKAPGADEPGATFKQSKQRQFTYSPLVRQVAGGLLLLAIVAAGASIAYRTCRASRGTMAPALNRAGASNTIHTAVATPTDERGFVTSYSLAGAGISSTGQHGLGRDGATRKDARASVCALLTSRPPYARSKAAGGFQSHTGA